MSTSPTLFSAVLINADRYRKLKAVRYVMYFILLFYYGISISPRMANSSRYPSLLQRLSINSEVYYGILIILVLATIILYFYSTRHEELGQFNIGLQQIEIETNGKKEVFPFEELSKLRIERGATYHYSHKKRNYLKKHNNWISFECKGTPIRYEFLIDSGRHNGQFEAMIRSLREHGIRHQYLSI